MDVHKPNTRPDLSARFDERLRTDASLVIVAGMPRSGSTWVYNAARLLLGSASEQFMCGWIEDVALMPDLEHAPIVLVKAHAFDKHLASRADVVICTHRDLRETASSLLRIGFVGDERACLDAIGDAITHADQWEPVADLVLTHRVICTDPMNAIQLVASALTTHIGEPSTDSLAACLARIPKHGPVSGDAYDPTTLLHRAHIKRDDEQAPTLSDASERVLEDRFGEWSSRHGYA